MVTSSHLRAKFYVTENRVKQYFDQLTVRRIQEGSDLAVCVWPFGPTYVFHNHTMSFILIQPVNLTHRRSNIPDVRRGLVNLGDDKINYPEHFLHVESLR